MGGVVMVEDDETSGVRFGQVRREGQHGDAVTIVPDGRFYARDKRGGLLGPYAGSSVVEIWPEVVKTVDVDARTTPARLADMLDDIANGAGSVRDTYEAFKAIVGSLRRPR